MPAGVPPAGCGLLVERSDAVASRPSPRPSSVGDAAPTITEGAIAASPLGAVGAGACNLCCSSIINFGVGTDANGGARVPFGVPQNTQLVGASFAQQWVVLDQKANRLGLTLSGLGRGRIGTR